MVVSQLIANMAYTTMNITGSLLKLPISILISILPKAEIREVFHGVHLPKDLPYTKKILDTVLDLNLASNEKTLAFIFNRSEVKALVGHSKDSLDAIQDVVQNRLGIENVTPNYKFFGARDRRVQHLCLLLKNNPLVAFALTKSKTHDGFELKAYDPNEKNPSLFLKLMRTMTGAGRKVNFEFTANMEYRSHSVYDDVSGSKIANPPLAVDDYACASLYMVLFFASCVHTTIHVLHFLYTSAFSYSSEGFKEMNQWAEDYDNNIGMKYLEVGVILIADKPDGKDVDRPLLTGTAGFGSSQASRPIMQELLNSWGRNPTADGFFNGLMNISEADMVKAGILTEFRKHFRLIKPYARAAAGALKEIDANKFEQAQTNLATYLGDCGDFKSNLKTFDQWLEIMAVTGIVHGGTLSYSRLIGCTEVVKWRKINQDTFDADDITLIGGGMGTTTGMQIGRHVMSSTLGGKKKYHPTLQRVLDDFDAKATALKESYKIAIMKLPNFDDDGFILTDFCPDGFDGKQLTLTTYI